MFKQDILGRALSVLFAELTDEVTEAKALEALGTGTGPFIVRYRDNGSKIRGEAPHIPAHYAMDISRLEKKAPPHYPHTKRTEERGWFV